jgi:light-regulated signal transduction histidine kinase (bacteriophytochrome)
MAPVDLAAMAAEAQVNLRPVLEQARARVEVGPLPTVEGDAVELVRLFQNLIGNAVKYRAAERPPVVRIDARRDGDQWEVTVADNGIGIAPEFHERIFRLFQRLHVRAEYEGTGIGLAACRKIVEHHGGRIWVDSAPGEGSAFRFSLPAP